MLCAFTSINDYTRLGHLIKEPQNFIPQDDNEYHALSLWREFLNKYTDDKYSAFITSETICEILDTRNENYKPEKIEKVARFLRDKLRPAQTITDDWLVYFVRKFK